MTCSMNNDISHNVDSDKGLKYCESGMPFFFFTIKVPSHTCQITFINEILNYLFNKKRDFYNVLF